MCFWTTEQTRIQDSRILDWLRFGLVGSGSSAGSVRSVRFGSVDFMVLIPLESNSNHVRLQKSH